ncbi:N-acetylglutamate synthase [Amniculicola lignicola CBS 123094]|uniref:Amino-acid acetyltransferase, mitochondrial n=1 Tax=Amniculicola lignicola CBS 123094 TaxID=1392246 RepID=A0A6A5W0M6_9PLEO|nr:N-acetylglutamate synthase [Amniculicola lignicola CBS 123094]
MNICHRARCQGLGRTTARLLCKSDKIRRVHACLRVSHPTFSTSARYHTPDHPGPSLRRQRQRAERDQLIKSLKESPGKRDAKNYLKHFDTLSPPKAKVESTTPLKNEKATTEAVERANHNAWRLDQTGVNLGSLYEPTKAVQNNPVFTQQDLPEKPIAETVELLHIALVKLRQPQALDDETLGCIALTLSQMVRLGLNIALVVDCDEGISEEDVEWSPAWEEMVREQAARCVDALEEFSEPGAFEVEHALSYSEVDRLIPDNVHVRGEVQVKNAQLLRQPIDDGIILVLRPVAYDSELRKVRVKPDEVVLALTRSFAGSTKHVEKPSNWKDASQDPILDRIIILDPLGGLPSESRADGAHVFINLEAEYADVRRELLHLTSATPGKESDAVGWSNPFSKFVETEVAPLPGCSQEQLTSAPPDRFVMNLDVVERSLKLLPPSSSALIITPAEAAISSQAAFLPTPSTGVRTRRSKNPLIHNLLTDKPMISSSLPAPLVNRYNEVSVPNPATFLKKGIPVTMIPDTRVTGPWQPPSASNPSIELENDPRINFPRLVDLIEDSFRRKLDAHHYLERVRGRVAGIIIAGDYEGGAICTWETAADVSNSSHPTTSPPDSPLWVPYLDKFAVLTQSQGSGGVADIVWGALTRSCFPDGLVWRSRTSNPVNKWYFERAVGMWNLPGGQWTMFWTTGGVPEESFMAKKQMGADKEASVEGNGKILTRWDSYVSVCTGVVPSWSDGKSPD